MSARQLVSPTWKVRMKFVSIAAAQPMWDSGPCATLGTSTTREWRNRCAARWPSSVGMFGSRSPEKISTGTSANSPLVC